MRTILFIMSICMLLNTTPVMATTNLTSYVVKNGVLTFSVKDTKTAMPACVAFRQQQMWAVKLGTPAGDRMARQLKEAILNQQAVAVTSAKDCADKAGVERPLSLTLLDEAPAARKRKG